MTVETIIAEINKDTFDHRNASEYMNKFSKGLSETLIRKISKDKNEPEWMLRIRLKALDYFLKTPLPDFGPNLHNLDFNQITFYATANNQQQTKDWNDVPEDIKRTFERLGIPKAEQTVLAGAGAQYECLAGDTPIFTNPKGPVKIKDIKVGDYVFAFDEKENTIKKTKVRAILEKGLNQIYEIMIDNKKVKATENHPFLVLSHYKKEGGKRGRYKREWKALKHLKKGDLVGMAKKLPSKGKPHLLNQPEIKKEVIGRNQFGARYRLDISRNYNHISLPEKTTKDLMWFLGLYMGDGYIKKEKGKDKKQVYFAIPEFQPELRNELEKVVKLLFDYTIKSKAKYYMSINSTILANFIEANGFKGNAHQKRLARWILQVPMEQKLAFLAGYTDSDGYATDERSHNILIFKSANRNLIDDLRQLVIYCNLHPSNIHLIKSKHPFDKKRIMEAYEIKITGDLKIVPSRYPPKAKRLHAKKHFLTYNTAEGTTFRKHTNEFLGFARIKSIKSAGTEKVYDINVEGYHNFIADGLIVHNSNMIYHNLKEEWEKQGVIFEDCDIALKKHPEIFKKYFMQCVPYTDHKFAALHYAVWSGGTFLYIPKGIKLTQPVQAYFRMNAPGMGQFEHTLIIVEEEAQAHYIEGCSAPKYGKNALHAGCVEIFVGKNSKARYSSVENWSKDTYNLNTKRSLVEENAHMEWVGGTLGSGVTMLYPCSILRGKNARADHLGITFANNGQIHDTGAKVIHTAPDGKSTIIMKSLSKDGGISLYRGLLKVLPHATNCTSRIECDALILDDRSTSNTLPVMQIENSDVTIAHEAKAGKLNDTDIFYLMSRGLSEEEAKSMIVNGFLEPIVKELPLEYAVELNRLIELEMEGSVG